MVEKEAPPATAAEGAEERRMSAMPDAAGEDGLGERRLSKPCFDLSNYLLKIDHFIQMQLLPTETAIEGAPNFRQIAGFPVFGTGQPTEDGFLKVLDKVPKGTEESPVKIKWFNMRQEPVIYINGTPYAPRDPQNLHGNLELHHPVEELDNLEKVFAEVIQSRVESDPKEEIKVHKDASFVENPMERLDVEESLKVNSVKDLSVIFDAVKEKDFPSLEVVRIPIVEENAPAESIIDLLVDSLKAEPASTNCIFSCQMGRGRTSLGMIIACLVKEIQITTELKQMAEIGLIAKETVTDLIKTKFESPLPKTQDDDDPFIKGEFDVIKELLEKNPEMVEGKKKIDYIIDVNGPAPKGMGIQNLRECVIETKWKYDVAAEEKQGVLRQMILNFLERYFYLICFATYALEHGPTGFVMSFQSWMDARPTLRPMIDNGKDKLEWYRQVDPAKLNTLKELINSPDYKENMGKLIKTVYDFAFQTYADLPRGPIKNNSMRKLAATTLMDILPPNISRNVNKKLEEQQTTSHDFVTLIGLVSYYGESEE